jgi:putative oxidoreductase
MLLNLLFPAKPDKASTSLFLLALRIIIGVLFMSHGIQKMMNFSELSAVFADPIGLGSRVSLILAIFGELACSIGFLFGILYRLAIIPMMFTMCVAFFVVHGADPFSVKELPLLYFIVFFFMWIAGPGKFSVDALLRKFILKKTQKNGRG